MLKAAVQIPTHHQHIKNWAQQLTFSFLVLLWGLACWLPLAYCCGSQECTALCYVPCSAHRPLEKEEAPRTLPFPLIPMKNYFCEMLLPFSHHHPPPKSCSIYNTAFILYKGILFFAVGRVPFLPLLPRSPMKSDKQDQTSMLSFPGKSRYCQLCNYRNAGSLEGLTSFLISRPHKLPQALFFTCVTANVEPHFSSYSSQPLPHALTSTPPRQLALLFSFSSPQMP